MKFSSEQSFPLVCLMSDDGCLLDEDVQKGGTKFPVCMKSLTPGAVNDSIHLKTIEPFFCVMLVVSITQQTIMCNLPVCTIINMGSDHVSLVRETQTREGGLNSRPLVLLLFDQHNTFCAVFSIACAHTS